MNAYQCFHSHYFINDYINDKCICIMFEYVLELLSGKGCSKAIRSHAFLFWMCRLLESSASGLVYIIIQALVGLNLVPMELILARCLNISMVYNIMSSLLIEWTMHDKMYGWYDVSGQWGHDMMMNSYIAAITNLGFPINWTQHGWRFNTAYSAPRALESASWELALKPIIYNNSSIMHAYMWRVPPAS